MKTKKCPKCGERLTRFTDTKHGVSYLGHSYPITSLFSDDYWSGKKRMCAHSERIEG